MLTSATQLTQVCTISRYRCEESDTGCGVATVDLNARIKVRVGGTEPILVYKQWNVTVSL